MTFKHTAMAVSALAAAGLLLYFNPLGPEDSALFAAGWTSVGMVIKLTDNG